MALLSVTLINFLSIYSALLFVRIILTWFQSQNWAQQIIYVLSPVTDPYLNIFRSVLPPLGGLDFSPMLAFIALSVVRSLLVTAI